MEPQPLPSPFLDADWSQVYLRIPHTSDTEQLWCWINDSNVTEHISVVFPVTFENEKDFITKALESFQEPYPTEQKFMICLKETGAVIGTMNLSNINWVHRTATTGALIGNESNRGKGYGREAKHLLLQYAFETLGLRKISSGAKAVNTRSLRYQASNGYREVGRQREHFIVNGRYVDLILTEVFASDWKNAFEAFIASR